MDSAASTIRTPDQRLRVFVSSTLGELSAERRAARSAVERLRLAPVMFELGARPHPPQDLYRAYLAQSDVFVGLYWQSYGWIAPGDEISGLDDEYRLSKGLPRLIYLKKPAEAMEPRLRTLLDQIRSDGDAAYKSFSSPEELAELLENDLAILMAERFDQSRRLLDSAGSGGLDDSVASSAESVPAPLTQLIGRDEDERRILELLLRDDVRLVTLIGPGGIGKSRLAIDIARTCTDRYPGGTIFVSLAAVHDPAFIPTAIAQAVGVRDTGVGTVEEKLATALRHRTALIVLDNFEQVLDAAPALTTILTEAPGVTLLVTSRILLRVGGEHAYEVGPLAIPDHEQRATREGVLASPAVELFVERARAVQPDFAVTDENAETIARVTEALDGVPLAIELAAARSRMLPPAAMLDRLDRQLPLLVGGVRDLPERQQTIRKTVEWSVSLLDEDERRLLALLGVFAGPFTLDAVESIAAADVPDPMGSLSRLVDNSLVRQWDRGGRSLFSLLSTVREYAREQLDVAGTHDGFRERHAGYYVELGASLEEELEGARQREWVQRLADERDNLRAAVRYLTEQRRWSTLASFSWALYIYWWVGGHLGEVHRWMDEVLDSGDELTDLTRATALYFRHAITFWQDPDGSVLRGLTESAELFHRADFPIGEALARVSVGLGLLAAAEPQPVEADDTLETALGLFRSAHDPWGEAMALIAIGRISLLSEHAHAGLNRFQESLTISRARRDELGIAIAVHHLGWAHLMLGEFELAHSEFEQSLDASIALGHEEGIAYGLEGLVAIAASRGDVDLAGKLLGASEILREETGLYNAPTFSFHQLLTAPITGGDRAGEFEAARQAGRRLSVAEAAGLGHALTRTS